MLSQPTPQYSRGMAKQRASSKRWIQRAKTDPWARGSHRSRAFFKLEQLDQKLNIFRSIANRSSVVLDLGCAPGGWTEYAVSAMTGGQQQSGAAPINDENASSVESTNAALALVVGVDLLPMVPFPGSLFIQGDMREDSIQQKVLAAAEGRPVDLVLSDMAPNATGDKTTDHFRSIELSEVALATAASTLSEGGSVLCKVSFKALQRGRTLFRCVGTPTMLSFC